MIERKLFEMINSRNLDKINELMTDTFHKRLF